MDLQARQYPQFSRLAALCSILAVTLMLGVAGCSGGNDLGASEDEFAPTDTGTGNPDASSPDPPPETERDFEFSQPASIDDAIFVANRTLNSVAIIDTTTLSITTIPVGFRPTRVVGPTPDNASSDSARAVVLNQGNSTATVIDPETLETSAYSILEASNSVKMDPTGRRAAFWYDNDERSDSQPAGDLSSVSILKTDAEGTEAYRVAVGFHVRKVMFSDDGSTTLVWTDDGISRIDLNGLNGDTVSPPTPLIPADIRYQTETPDDVFATADARYVAARLPDRNAIVVLDTTDQQRHLVSFPSKPTDLNLLEDGQPSAWVMLPAEDRAVRITIPDGIERAADATSPEPVPPTSDAGMSSDGGTSDAGSSPDAWMTDSGTSDSGSSADVGDTNPDAGEWPPGGPLDGVDVFDIDVPGLGAATLNPGTAGSPTTGLLYTTAGEETRVVILDVETGDQQTVALQKKVRGANAAPEAGSFVIFNQKQPGQIPPDATPGDPEYVAKSWGITALDAASGASRLLLTQYEPGPATLWTPPSGTSGDPTVFVAYDPPDEDADSLVLPQQRDVIGLNLQTFRHRTYRMPSVPVSLGAIGSVRSVYVNQRHPQGRMTFIEVGTEETRTITGYQLNSRIR